MSAPPVVSAAAQVAVGRRQVPVEGEAASSENSLKKRAHKKQERGSNGASS